MARYNGNVGYAQDQIEVSPGVWKDQMIEANYTGDVIRDSRKLEDGESLNDDITVGNSISIVADKYANDHFFKIRYVGWMGSLWKVTKVDVAAPRLILSLGGIYNGPTA